MTETIQTHDPDAILLLKAAAHQFCGKHYDGENMQPRAEIKHWIPNVAIADSSEKLLRIVSTLNKQSSFCAIRGALRDTDAVKGEKVVRRFKGKDDPFEECPRRWVAVDHDGVEVQGKNLHQRVLSLIEKYPAEFQNATCVYQATSRYGLEKDLYVRLFWLLEDPASCAQLKAYFTHNTNIQADVSLYNPVQPHYTSAPTFPKGFSIPIALEDRVGIVEGLMERVDLTPALAELPVAEETTYSQDITLGDGNEAQIHHAIEKLLEQGIGQSRHHTMIGCMTELVALGCPADQAIAFGNQFLENNGREPNSDSEVEDAYIFCIEKAQSGDAKVNVSRLDDTFPDYEEGEDVLPEGEENDMEDVIGYSAKVKHAFQNAKTYLSRNYKNGGLLRWNQETWEWRNGCYYPLEAERLSSTLMMETQFSPNIISSIEKSVHAITFRPDVQTNQWLDGRSKKSMVVFANGMISVDDMLTDRFQDLTPLTPDYFNTHRLTFNYDPKAQCPVWLDFLRDCFGNDKEQLREFQKMFGYLLTGDKAAQKFFVLQGAPRCGKGTVFEVLRSLMGRNNCESMLMSSLTSDFALHPLVGKSLWLMDEVNEQGKNIDGRVVDLIKAQTGGSDMSINRKSKDIVSNVDLDGRIVMACNRLPGFLDPSGAIAARMVLFRFVNSFVGRENLKLGMLLKAESAGIFNWALQGVVDLMEDGNFAAPESVKELLEEYQDAMAPIQSFSKEMLLEEKGTTLVASDVYGIYQSWAHDMGRGTMSSQKFGLELRQQSIFFVKKRKRIKGKLQYVYRGIGLTEDALDRQKSLAGFD